MPVADVEKIIRTEPLEAFYDVGKELGRGKFAIVKRCTEKATGSQYAAKILKKRRRGKSVREDILVEIDIMRQGMDHNRIIKLYEVFESSAEFHIIIELATGGELFRVIAVDPLPEEKARDVVYQILEGVQHLHSLNIVHMDLKPENLLLYRKGALDIKIVDFGLAAQLQEGQEMRSLVGTAEYVSPEILSFEPLSTYSDMWSIGALTYALLAGYSPFQGETHQETFLNVSTCDYDFEDEVFDAVSAETKEFIEKLLVRVPRKRMTAQMCLQHPWLKSHKSGATNNLDGSMSSLDSALCMDSASSMEPSPISSTSSSFSPAPSATSRSGGSTCPTTVNLTATTTSEYSRPEDMKKVNDKLSQISTLATERLIAETVSKPRPEGSPTSTDSSTSTIKGDDLTDSLPSADQLRKDVVAPKISEASDRKEETLTHSKEEVEGRNEVRVHNKFTTIERGSNIDKSFQRERERSREGSAERSSQTLDRSRKVHGIATSKDQLTSLDPKTLESIERFRRLKQKVRSHTPEPEPQPISELKVHDVSERISRRKSEGMLPVAHHRLDTKGLIAQQPTCLAEEDEESAKDAVKETFPLPSHGQQRATSPSISVSANGSVSVSETTTKKKTELSLTPCNLTEEKGRAKLREEREASLSKGEQERPSGKPRHERCYDERERLREERRRAWLEEERKKEEVRKKAREEARERKRRELERENLSPDSRRRSERSATPSEEKRLQITRDHKAEESTTAAESQNVEQNQPEPVQEDKMKAEQDGEESKQEKEQQEEGKKEKEEEEREGEEKEKQEDPKKEEEVKKVQEEEERRVDERKQRVLERDMAREARKKELDSGKEVDNRVSSLRPDRNKWAWSVEARTSDTMGRANGVRSFSRRAEVFQQNEKTGKGDSESANKERKNSAEFFQFGLVFTPPKGAAKKSEASPQSPQSARNSESPKLKSPEDGAKVNMTPLTSPTPDSRRSNSPQQQQQALGRKSCSPKPTVPAVHTPSPTPNSMCEAAVMRRRELSPYRLSPQKSPEPSSDIRRERSPVPDYVKQVKSNRRKTPVISTDALDAILRGEVEEDSNALQYATANPGESLSVPQKVPLESCPEEEEPPLSPKERSPIPTIREERTNNSTSAHFSNLAERRIGALPSALKDPEQATSPEKRHVKLITMKDRAQSVDYDRAMSPKSTDPSPCPTPSPDAFTESYDVSKLPKAHIAGSMSRLSLSANYSALSRSTPDLSGILGTPKKHKEARNAGRSNSRRMGRSRMDLYVTSTNNTSSYYQAPSSPHIRNARLSTLPSRILGNKKCLFSRWDSSASSSSSSSKFSS